MDKSFAEHRAAFDAWHDSRSPDLAQAEARIDCLLQTLFEMSNELNQQAGELVYRSAMLGTSIRTIEHQQQTIEQQARSIVALRAEIARMRTDPTRKPTRTESIVRALGALYAPEGE